jgi:replicative DNA helicase
VSHDLPRRRRSVAGVVERVDDTLAGVPNPDTVATGFPGIDRMLGGGLRRRDLIVLGGDVGAGKSSLALGIALRVAARGERAVFLSAEMDEDRVYERALALEGRVRLNDIRRGDVGDEARAALGAGAVRLRDRPLVPIPTAGLDFEAVLGHVREQRAALTVVDYLQALPPPPGASTQDEQAAAAVRLLKEAALSGDTAVLLTAQLPRHNPKRRDVRPNLDDFGALGAVKFHGDVVLGLFREEMYQTWRGLEGATELIVAKNRHGATGFVDLYFYREWMRFEDMLDPDR